MNKPKIIEYILGNPDRLPKHVEILQKYFKVDWKFAKPGYIYYIDPESDMTMCQPANIINQQPDRYQFELINTKTIKEYVDRLQKPKDDFDRAVEQPTSRIQCTSSKATIASGHLEYRTINFRMGSKAKIGKANISI